VKQSTIETLISVALEAWRCSQDGRREMDDARRLAAKRNNHRIVLLATTVNAIALTIFGVAFVTPHITGSLREPYLGWILVAVGLHLVAQSLYGFLRAGD
jgi:hypothetical protein